MTLVRALISTLALATLACRNEPEPTRTSPSEAAPTQPARESQAHLIRYACEGFNAAVAEGAPSNSLLSHSARRAVELGGPKVEAATQRWALLPPAKLLELVDHYERGAQRDPEQCAGLRRHLKAMSERQAERSSAH